MARYGPPDDTSNQPTFRADPGPGGEAPTGRFGSLRARERGGPPTPSEPPESFEPAPAPWYRKRAVLVGWGLLVAILVALIIYGLIDLASRGGGGPAPSHTTTTTTTPATTTTAPTATTAPTTTEPPSNTIPAPAPPPAAPPAQSLPPSQAPPRKRRHLPELPPLPSVITVPGLPDIHLP